MKISVICPVFNTDAELLHIATQSVLSAIRNDVDELILVDDASANAETIRAVQQIAAKDPRVVVIRNPHNLGHTATRSVGLRAARGSWIGFIDHDDIWSGRKIEIASRILEEFPNARWIVGNYRSLYPDGSSEMALRLSDHCEGQIVAPNVKRLSSPILTKILIGNAWLHFGAMLIRKDLLDAAGQFDRKVYYGEDTFLFCKLSVLTDMLYIDDDWYTWRRHPNNFSNSPVRLTDKYLSGYLAASHDPLLKGFRRELRWALYSARKGLAVNNLLSGNTLRAWRFAVEAYFSDPREVKDLRLFSKLATTINPAKREKMSWSYSGAQRAAIKSDAMPN